MITTPQRETQWPQLFLDKKWAKLGPNKSPKMPSTKDTQRSEDFGTSKCHVCLQQWTRITAQNTTSTPYMEARSIIYYTYTHSELIPLYPLGQADLLATRETATPTTPVPWEGEKAWDICWNQSWLHKLNPRLQTSVHVAYETTHWAWLLACILPNYLVLFPLAAWPHSANGNQDFLSATDLLDK